MDVGRALTFIREDARWKEKVAIGTGVMLVSILLSPILIGLVGVLIVLGYSIRLLQNVRDGNPTPLPEWDQWGDDLMRGLKLFVVLLIWSVPMIVISIPNVLGSVMAASAESPDNPAFVIGNIISLCSGCLIAIYGIFLALMQPGINVAFARDEQIGTGLRFGEIWGWTRERLGQVIVVVLVLILVSIGIGLAALVVGALLCLIGLVVTIPLAQLVIYLFQYHLFGQLARQSGEEGPCRYVTAAAYGRNPGVAAADCHKGL